MDAMNIVWTKVMGQTNRQPLPLDSSKKLRIKMSPFFLNPLFMFATLLSLNCRRDVRNFRLSGMACFISKWCQWCHIILGGVKTTLFVTLNVPFKLRVREGFLVVIAGDFGPLCGNLRELIRMVVRGEPKGKASGNHQGGVGANTPNKTEMLFCGGL